MDVLPIQYHCTMSYDFHTYCDDSWARPCLYFCVDTIWRDATSEPMNLGVIFLMDTTITLLLHALLCSMINHSKNTKNILKHTIRA